MNSIERFYRLTLLSERVLQLNHELLAIIDDMYPCPQQDQLLVVMDHLLAAIDTLGEQPEIKAPLELQQDDLAEKLRLSIESIMKKRSADIGGGL